VVRERKVAADGEFVAAMIDGETTVKTFKRPDDGNYWLVPHNPALYADRRRRRDDPGQGRGRAPPGLMT
jgi:SOS-response transcriptional repressor LexA